MFLLSDMKQETQHQYQQRRSSRSRDVAPQSSAQQPASLLNGKKKSNSTGGSGFTFGSLIPSVGKKLGIFGHKNASGSPVYTSSTNSMSKPMDVLNSGSQKPKLTRSGTKLFRSQSMKDEPRYSVSKLTRSQSVRTDARSTSGESAPTKVKLKRNRSADMLANHFKMASSLVEMSDKLVQPEGLYVISSDVNNNKNRTDDDSPVASATLKRNRSQKVRANETSESPLNPTVKTKEQQSDDNDGETTSDTGGNNVQSRTRRRRRKAEDVPEKNSDSDDRERVAELKEAQSRVERRRTSSSSTKRDRSRSKDRSRRKQSGKDRQSSETAEDRPGSPQDVDTPNQTEEFKAAPPAAPTVGGSDHLSDPANKFQHFSNYCDTLAVPNIERELNVDEAVMLARATKAIQEHVKDVTEKTRATCCIGKPPVKKETYNNHYNSHYHGGAGGKTVNYNVLPENDNFKYQQENLRPPPDYHISPPPYDSEHYPQSPNSHNYHNDHHPYVHSHQRPGQGSYPNDKRTPPPPVQSPLIINNHQIGHVNVPDSSRSEHHYVINENTGTTYIKGKLLGKGGFAKCYELTDVRTNKSYAGKIISKNRLTKPHQKEKILREIELHKSFKHRHVVAFHSYFEDAENVYIILELCSMKSLVHVLKCRKTLTEAEVRHFMRHLVEGCRYIHSQHVIHRDLKLGNMLLNDKMLTKIADFGLATRVEYEGEKKMTVCGTPNYIAPEVLQKKGHSYEADIWALGCIMYAMLVGKPPFETSTLKETYMRITANKYFIPPHVSKSAKHLITKLLTPEPHHRPSLENILTDDFFTSGHMPKTLPTSCCETPPKFPTSNTSSNVSIPSRPRSYAAPVSSPEAMQKIQASLAQLKGSRRSASQIITKAEKASPSTGKETGMRQATSTPTGVRRSESAELKNVPSGSAIRLYQMLTNCLEQMPQDSQPIPLHSTKQQWVTKWVDYSNKYGFGFQLSDKSVGILFNDTTRMLLANDGKTCQYNDLSNRVYTFTTDTAPEEYQKKVTLLLYFAQYMDDHLIHGGDLLVKRENKSPPCGIFMKKWFRTGKAIVMYLNNGTLQVNFFEDHTKVILCPEGQDYCVTYINSKRQAVTYKLLQFRHFGCHSDIEERLRYARRMLESIINIEGEAV